MLRRIPIISFGSDLHASVQDPKTDAKALASNIATEVTEAATETTNDDGDLEAAPTRKSDSPVQTVALESPTRTDNAPDAKTPTFVESPIGHQTCCSICRSDFERGEKLRVLPCNHLFHQPCIDQWLLGTRSAPHVHTNCCPLCKAEVGRPPVDQTEAEAGSREREQQKDGVAGEEDQWQHHVRRLPADWHSLSCVSLTWARRSGAQPRKMRTRMTLTTQKDR